MAVKPVPDGYHTVTPYLVVHNADGLIKFLQKVFDVGEVEALRMPDGKIGHAEVHIGDSVVMISDPLGSNPPSPAMLHLYLEDSDAVYRRALAAGATSFQEPKNQFYGDRESGVQDAFGNRWWFATHIEDVSPEEMQRRVEAWAQQAGSSS